MRYALFKACIAAVAVAALVVPAQGAAGLKVRDARGNEVGELAGSWSPRNPDPGHWYFKYRLARTDAVWFYARKNRLETLTGPGDNRALFTTADCSGKAMFATIPWPPRTLDRRAMVLPAGPADRAASTWLWVSAQRAPRVVPEAGTVFRSQWTEDGACAPYPAPGYTLTGPAGGFWMHPVEDLYVKYQRPFQIGP
jgi:hypothetical protein